MKIVSHAALRLRELREKAKLSIREMAEELGIPKGKYEHYEARYKRPYLPADFAAEVARVLAARGVPSEEVLSLAIPGESKEPDDNLNLRLRYEKLSSHRQRMVREFLEELEAAEAANQDRPTEDFDA
ncbi:helix-turn-helix transcriptional regulator [Paracoccus sp. (in: a-proteobacteria)]|uniref:helix-turn-helix domain-containing protein n=1 Tax=Paracoccus sp. TaxID=267 RepID=UPI002897ABF5|nr:helix-turn-helix transcriptional regulator [Paracoccus sp. (in: a-proteobacteria)]